MVGLELQRWLWPVQERLWLPADSPALPVLVDQGSHVEQHTVYMLRGTATAPPVHQRVRRALSGGVSLAGWPAGNRPVVLRLACGGTKRSPSSPCTTSC